VNTRKGHRTNDKGEPLETLPDGCPMEIGKALMFCGVCVARFGRYALFVGKFHGPFPGFTSEDRAYGYLMTEWIQAEKDGRL